MICETLRPAVALAPLWRADESAVESVQSKRFAPITFPQTVLPSTDTHSPAGLRHGKPPRRGHSASTLLNRVR